MLNKFYDDGTEKMPDSRLLAVMSGWAEVIGMHNLHRGALIKAVGTIPVRVSREDFVQLLNERVGNDIPDLAVANGHLKSAFQDVVGWGVKWRNIIRGEVIGVQEAETGPGFSMLRPVRAPNEFHEDEGVLLNAIVGPNPYLRNYGVWLGVGYEPSQRMPFFIDFSDMFEVQFIAPIQQQK